MTGPGDRARVARQRQLPRQRIRIPAQRATPPSASRLVVVPRRHQQTVPQPSRDWHQRVNSAATALTALAATAALLFTGLSAQQAQEELRNRGEELKISREGMVTQRFTVAVAQLGDNSLDVRLGGIYGLQRIMNDSRTDQPAVVSVLSAYVRTRANSSKGKSKSAQIAGLPKASEDVAAAVEILGARNTEKEGPNGIDWSGAYLVGVDLHGAKLDSAFLTKTDLRGAMLEGVYIRGAFLTGADLKSAIMNFAEFHSTQLNDADLRRAYLKSADFEGAKLIGADLRGADLSGAYLRDANFQGANLSTATGLTPDQLKEAGIFNDTQLPSNIADDRRVQARIKACEAEAEECLMAIAEG